ncbi:MAG: hypothetical protein NZM10_00160 [Fimbriimonadales bacterium]|nr:hypothetical protein [Fimbriimonadales bacterium]
MHRQASDPLSDTIGWLMLGGGLLLLTGCGGSGAAAPPRVDLALFAGDENANAQQLRTLYAKLSQMAETMRNQAVRESPPLRTPTPHGLCRPHCHSARGTSANNRSRVALAS